jgi:septal ring factor EnvC (AmiA/AmiB activator)
MLPPLLRFVMPLAVALAIGASLWVGGVQAQSPGRSGLSRSVPFEEARGTLRLPVAGEQIVAFLERPDGSVSPEVLIKTRPGAVVVAPSDGGITYTGEFRSYGNLVIIDTGDGYQFLLSGLSLVNVELGQRVLAGEPIGTLPRAAANGDAPTLRVELRKNGRAVDPTPWWRKG